MRRATLIERADYSRSYQISTHALREEGDGCNMLEDVLRHLFLPTPSARRATHQVDGLTVQQPISTHALREEGDEYTYTDPTTEEISTHALREEGDAPAWGPPPWQ